MPLPTLQTTPAHALKMSALSYLVSYLQTGTRSPSSARTLTQSETTGNYTFEMVSKYVAVPNNTITLEAVLRTVVFPQNETDAANLRPVEGITIYFPADVPAPSLDQPFTYTVTEFHVLIPVDGLRGISTHEQADDIARQVESLIVDAFSTGQMTLYDYVSAGLDEDPIDMNVSALWYPHRRPDRRPGAGYQKSSVHRVLTYVFATPD